VAGIRCYYGLVVLLLGLNSVFFGPKVNFCYFVWILLVFACFWRKLYLKNFMCILGIGYAVLYCSSKLLFSYSNLWETCSELNFLVLLPRCVVVGFLKFLCCWTTFCYFLSDFFLPGTVIWFFYSVFLKIFVNFFLLTEQKVWIFFLDLVVLLQWRFELFVSLILLPGYLLLIRWARHTGGWIYIHMRSRRLNYL